MKAAARITVAAAALALTLLSSSIASAQGEERREPLRPNRVLFIGGSVLFGAAYIPAIPVATNSGREGDSLLYIPIGGPWADLAVRGGCAPNSCTEEAGYKTLLIASGVFQAVGVGAFIASYFVPDNGRATRMQKAAASAKPVVVPQVGRGGAGLAVVGRF